jgi:hypothetical protein
MLTSFLASIKEINKRDKKKRREFFRLKKGLLDVQLGRSLRNPW